MDDIGLLLAACSLLVASIALYRTALRRPRLEVFFVSPRPDLLHVERWSGLMPDDEGAFLQLAMYCHNTGASAGILEGMEVIRLVGVDDVFETSPEAFTVKSSKVADPRSREVEFPLSVAAGELRMLYLTGPIRFRRTDERSVAPREALESRFAESLGGLGYDAQVEVVWSHVVGTHRLDRVYERIYRGYPRFVRRRQRHARFRLSPSDIRNYFIRVWHERAADPQFSARARELASAASMGWAEGVMRSVRRGDFDHEFVWQEEPET